MFSLCGRTHTPPHRHVCGNCYTTSYAWLRAGESVAASCGLQVYDYVGVGKYKAVRWVPRGMITSSYRSPCDCTWSFLFCSLTRPITHYPLRCLTLTIGLLCVCLHVQEELFYDVSTTSWPSTPSEGGSRVYIAWRNTAVSVYWPGGGMDFWRFCAYLGGTLALAALLHALVYSSLVLCVYGERKLHEAGAGGGGGVGEEERRPILQNTAEENAQL